MQSMSKKVKCVTARVRSAVPATHPIYYTRTAVTVLETGLDNNQRDKTGNSNGNFFMRDRRICLYSSISLYTIASLFRIVVYDHSI